MPKLTLCNTPEILSSLDLPSIRSHNVLRRADDTEWHSRDETLCVLCSLWIIVLDRRGVDADPVLCDRISQLARDVRRDRADTKD